MLESLSRRNFAKYSGAAAAAAGISGCLGGGGETNTDSSGGQESTTGSGSPLQWIGPAYGVRDGQGEKYAEVTGNEVELTTATGSTVQQQVLSGGRETMDVFSLDTSTASALTEANDASYPVNTADLDNWSENTISDLFLNPGERIPQLEEQTETINQEVWENKSEGSLRLPPYAYNFDAIGYNPKYVDDVSKWSALFDDQYEGKVLVNGAAPIQIPQTMMHLLDNDQIDGSVGELNNPTEDQLDTVIDYLVEQKANGQFRSTWTAYGNSVNLMAGEEAVIGDLWQPAALDVRRSGTPCEYATMSKGAQGYRFWYVGMAPLKPGASDRNNLDAAHSLYNDIHLGAWFPGYIQNWGYSVPHYPNKELVRDGSDSSGGGMGPEYYDWAYEGKKTYESVENPALFDPQSYDWSSEEGTPASDGQKRDCGSIQERIDRIGFFQIWPDNADYMLDRWQEFQSA
ncbi:extracellular solute-binding protein [Halobium palmae]|uniref:Extracellular solute-binding protein n=1 Tax=Halobium palmae TaxID=1776492 RepID=A0ABD5RUK9_9EURY